MRVAITLLVVLGLVGAAVVAVVASDPLAAADEALDRAMDEAIAEAKADLESRRGVAPEGGGAAAEPTGEPTSEQRWAASVPLPQLFTPDDVEAAQAGMQVYYQYSDSSGGVHFVPHWEQVPAAHRGRAGRVEMAPAARAPGAPR